MRGETHLGTLTLDYIDQPWFYCHFDATPEWEAVRPTLDAWTEATLARNDPDELRIARAWQAVDALKLTLVPIHGGERVDEFLIHVEDDEARFRY
ncbi:hypothetical protein ACFYRC_22175 [Streptomyces sp. NPDC005279]